MNTRRLRELLVVFRTTMEAMLALEKSLNAREVLKGTDRELDQRGYIIIKDEDKNK